MLTKRIINLTNKKYPKIFVLKIGERGVVWTSDRNKAENFTYWSAFWNKIYIFIKFKTKVKNSYMVIFG